MDICYCSLHVIDRPLAEGWLLTCWLLLLLRLLPPISIVHDSSLHDCSFCEIANLSLFPLSDLSLYCHHPCCNTMSPAVADSSNAGQLMGSQEKDQSGCLLPKLVLISTRPERPKGMKDVMKQAWRVQSLGPQICRGAPRTSSWQYCSDCFAICDDLVFAEIEAQAGAGKQESARSK